MVDLISRDELGAAIDNWLTIDRYYHPYSKQKTIPVSELVDIIKLLPSAQPEIVRCKDCKWWEKKEDSTLGYCNAVKHWHFSDHLEIQIYSRYEPDFFCADGKRRSENDGN